MRQFLTLFLIFSIYTNSIAQTFDFGQVSISDFSRTDLDSNANAIVLNEFGRSSVFVDDYDNRIKLQHEYHVLIRINNKEGFKNFNLGGIGNYNNKGSKYQGLTDFKLSFGASVFEYAGDFEMVIKKALYIMYKNSSSVLGIIKK